MTLEEILSDIHALEKEMHYFEHKYGIRSETFYPAYMSGEEPEDDAWVMDFGEWAAVYRTWLERQAMYRNEVRQQQRDPQSIIGLVHVTSYRDIIEKILANHLAFAPQERDIETLAISDHESGNYLFLDLGWQKPRRIHSVIFHLHIKDGKIWIEQDWTEGGVARELLSAGVPPQDIVLGFQPPDMRPFAQELLKTA